jgi:hypothetical protein
MFRFKKTPEKVSDENSEEEEDGGDELYDTGEDVFHP